ncbi:MULTISPECIES: putative zinc-binding metallopeptidase [unclassified Sphingobacterium]|uniref:putative zinc-binding metallopeptidase n=1 Tax=unclassified Sphingobacterium TaxID=2609468 RepID=UPI0025DE2036|nr:MULTISPECIES: putative zinc-binding metallopeptidase [unclassified Sphingobacterium]
MKSTITLLVLFALLSFAGCAKDSTKINQIDESTDYFTKKEKKPKSAWNELDYLADSIQKAYGVEIIYEFSPRTITGSTFFVPARYDQALEYTKVILDKIWLKTLKERFPKFFNTETPIEFIIVGGFVHFNDITVSASAAGAGLNAQFYRLGMGGVNNFSKTNKNWLRSHISTLFHEHAHQIDHKIGRGHIYDRISQGEYYGLTYGSRSDAQANDDGFFTAYGGYAPEEDFATTVESITLKPKSEIQTIISKNPKLETKYKMVYQKYLDMGIDLHELQPILDSLVYQVNY